jgi:hypothetical protein
MDSRLGSHYQRYQPQIYQEQNSKAYDQNSYNNVYNPQFNEQLSTSQEPDIVYEKTEHYLTVSSRDRDLSTYPNVNKYVINFPREFKNISTIELIQAIIPDANNVTQEPYILLIIDELEDVMVSTDRHISDAFAILQPCAPTTAGGFIQIDKRIHENVVKYYKAPKASLGRMSISLVDYNGTLFDFGADATDLPTKALQNTFVFKIVCLEKQRAQLNHRNVF